MLSLSACASLPSVCLLWKKKVYWSLLLIFLIGFFFFFGMQLYQNCWYILYVNLLLIMPFANSTFHSALFVGVNGFVQKLVCVI